MGTRHNPLWKTILLLIAVGGFAYLSYHFLVEKGMLQNKPQTFMGEEERARIREVISNGYAEDTCLIEIGSVIYRAKTNDYKVTITLDEACENDVTGFCRGVYDLVYDLTDREVAVWAYATGGRLMGRYIP